MNPFIKILILCLFLFSVSLTKIYSQCAPNSIAFNNGRMEAFACGNSGYTSIADIENPPAPDIAYRWEVSFRGGTYTTLRNVDGDPFSGPRLAKSDITDYIIDANSKAPGDYRIKRVTNSSSDNCDNYSEPVILYYAEDTASVSGGVILGKDTICSGDDGTLTLQGHTGPILKWESSIDNGVNWISIDNTTNQYEYLKLTSDTCFRALVDNVCLGTIGSIDSDKYSEIFCVTIAADMTAGTASTTPTLCINTALTSSITHSTTFATGIGTPTNLPTGVTATWASNVITITGTPSVAGTFNYSIPLTGGCGTVNAIGTIIITEDMTAGTASATPTLCINTALTNITHATTLATGIGTPTNLPTGLTAAWLADVITISGTPSVAGTFNYSIPLTGGCGTLNATGTITVNSNLTPSFEANSFALTTYETYAVNDEIKFNNLNTGGEIDVLWDFGDGSTSSELHPSYTYTELGTYRVTLTITYDYGCSGPYYEDIEIIKGYNIMVPNGFTPNGDGVNDYFKPVYIGVVTTLIEVYNTWGSMVYSEEGNILKGWNGFIKNTEAENGNYIYKIIAKPFNTTIPIVLNGAFTLMK